jgi:hypothetical protein
MLLTKLLVKAATALVLITGACALDPYCDENGQCAASKAAYDQEYGTIVLEMRTPGCVDDDGVVQVYYDWQTGQHKNNPEFDTMTQRCWSIEYWEEQNQRDWPGTYWDD